MIYMTGPIVRLGPNEVSFASCRAALTMMRPGKSFHKTEYYEGFLPGGVKDLFTEIREPVHAAGKRTIGPFYTAQSVAQYAPEIRAVQMKLLDELDKQALPEYAAACDLGKLLHFMTFDVSSQKAVPTTMLGFSQFCCRP